MADHPQSFSEWVSRQSRPRTAVSAAPPRPNIDVSAIAGQTAGRSSQQMEGNEQDFLSWVVDILSRPLYGMTNKIQSQVNRNTELQQAIQGGDPGGAAASVAGQVANTFLPGDFLAGMFSTDPAVHRTTSDVLEQSTDKIGGAFDPNYVDERDNVNPVLKGAVGLAGDIAIDPLTWIPGAILAKGINLGTRGIRAATAGGKAAAEALRPVTKAGEATESIVPDLAKAAETTATEANRIDVPVSKAEGVDLPQTTVPVPEIPASVADQIKANPRTAKMTEVLDDLGRERPKALPQAETGMAGAVLSPEDWWREFQRLSPKKTVTIKSPGLAPREVSFREFSNMLKNENLDAQVLLKSMYRKYREAYAVAQRRSTPATVDAVGKMIDDPVKAAQQAVPPTETLTRQIERFRELLAQDEARIEAAFGSGLMDQLRRMSNPERFDQIIQQMSEILRPTNDLTDITDLTGQPALRKMFKALGIDPVATNAARRQATSNVGGPNVNEALDRMADPKLGAVSQVDGDVLHAFKQTYLKNFLELDSYKFETKGGTRRTDQGVGKGLGRNERAMNTHFQWDFFKAITIRVVDRVAKSGQLKGAERTKVVGEQVMAALRKGEELLDQHGIPMYLDFDGEKLALSIGQALEALFEDPALMRQVLFNVETAIPTTNLLDAIFFATKKNASVEGVAAQLGKIDKRNLKEGAIPNRLAPGGAGNLRYGYTPNRGKKPVDAPEKGYKYVPHKQGSTVKGWYKVWDADFLRTRLAEHIVAKADQLREIAIENANSYAQRLGAETLDLTQQQVDELTELVMDPERLGAALREMADIPSRIQKEAFEAGTMKASSDSATVLVTESAPAMAIPQAEAAVKVADATKREAVKAAKKGKKPKEQAKAGQEAGKAENQGIFNEQADEAQRLSEEFDPSGNAVPYSSIPSYREVRAGIIGKLDPLRRAFNVRDNLRKLWDLLNDSDALYGNWVAVRHAKMNELNRKFGGFVPGTQTPILRQAFQDVQRGVKSKDPQIAEAAGELSRLMSELVDPTGENLLLGNAFIRSSIGLEHIQRLMNKNGLSFKFDLDEAAKAAKAKGSDDLLSEVVEQWRGWDIEDPLDFISRFDAAVMRAFTDYSVGQSFVRRATREGWTSTTPKAGYSRLATKDGSIIASAIPSNVYIRDDLLSELKRLEEVMYASRQIEGDLGKFISDYFDPVQSAWKKGITIYRLGHHVRNMVGDTSMTFVAEGRKGFVKSSRDAFKVMQLRNSYEGVDIARALKELGEYNLTGQGDILSRGKFGNLSASDLFDAAERSGLFRSARVVEDYLDQSTLGITTGKNIVEKVAEKVSFTGTRAEKLAMGVSEYREHYARLQHFLQIIEKAQETGRLDLGLRGALRPKNVEELFREAADKVKRYHPDVSMLSPFELRYMRRLIPFYSWFRGILPAIVESMLINPGRVNVFPKASYNLAVMMGVDPLSLSDPFPTDQLFPSFLTDQMTGPQFEVGGSYFGINPGIAHIDVLNSFGADPIRGVAGMTSPLLRMPAELLSGGTWGTGAQIKDDSDYIDSSLPIINYLANISGFSPTGSAVSLLQGRGLDPQYQQAAGNKGPVDQWLSAVNWLTGFGVNNQSRPNFINYAEIEKRNRAGEQPSAF